MGSTELSVARKRSKSSRPEKNTNVVLSDIAPLAGAYVARAASR